MPKVSVIIPAYDIEPYLPRCLDSLLEQTHKDFEAIVVDDKSPDGCGKIADAYAAKDPRFVAVHHEVNQGLHLARVTGVEHMSGDYVLFLDGDDELAPTMLAECVAKAEETGADILHTGRTFLAENGVTDDENAAMEAYANRPSMPEFGAGVIRSVYDEDEGKLTEWRTTQRIFTAELVREGFAHMTKERLERAEDGYETFVLSALAKSSAPFEECMGYIYHYGLGVTGASAITVERFDWACDHFARCLKATRDFVASQGDDLVLLQCYAGMRHKMLELITNDWEARVADADKAKAVESMTTYFPKSEVQRELWRFVRDLTWQRFAAAKDGKPFEKVEKLELYKAIAEEQGLITGDDEAALRAKSMRQRALNHLTDAQGIEAMGAYDEQDIRIFVTTHKRVDVPECPMLQPVQVGWGEGKDRFLDCLHDDEGENIAHFNPMYCELTTQYWAWKNAPAKYVGFCHYRRYFNFSDTTYEQNPFGEIIDGYIDERAAKRYGFDEESIRRALAGADVVTTPIQCIKDMPGEATTPYEQYAAAPYLKLADLERVCAIVKEMHPDYAEDVDNFINGCWSCFCNMYVMRWDIFDDYCSWMFPILEAFCKDWDTSRLSREALRTPGHLSERLFNIFLLHALRSGADWKVKELQCVHFEYPDHVYPLEPVGFTNHSLLRRPVVPVVLASDDAYVPMLTTTILSMLENASTEKYYDVVVFERDISYQHKQQMQEYFARFANASVRFFNVRLLISGYDLATNNAHISLETYYRFLIQEAFADYDKVLYLDSDLIIQGDVAELFDTELGDDLVLAVRDTDFLGNLNYNDGERMDYAKDVLGLREPYDYFQAGVLVLNTAGLRALHSVEDWLRIATTVDYLYDDQDILNAECQGRVRFADARWNVMHDCAGRVAKVFSFAPAKDFDAYMAARTNPLVIHYAGFEKPWTNPNCDYASVYWSYARRTPFVEQLVARVAVQQMLEKVPQGEDALHMHEKAVGEDSPLRKFIDPIAPYGTARREVLKAIGRAVQGKK